MTKYNNRKVEMDGYRFDSQMEANRYWELKQLIKNGEIQGLEVHPAFELISKGQNIYGLKYRAVTYKADFRYFDVKKNHPVVEDIKGFKTKEYQIKKKLFLKLNPDCEFLET